MSEIGSFVMDVIDQSTVMSPFQMDAEVMISGGVCGQDGVSTQCGGEGISFVYGDLPSWGGAFGEKGAGSGLRVSLLTSMWKRIDVVYGDELIGSVEVGDVMRSELFTPLRIWYSDLGLEVMWNGVAYISNMTIPGWDPKADWQFGFGARTSTNHDKHWLSSVSIRADSLLSTPTSAKVQVTMNGQQFTSSSYTHTYGIAPVVCSFSPSSGPTFGGTNVTIYGSNFENGLNYTCSFGGEVTDATGIDGSHIICLSPMVVDTQNASSSVPLEVSINYIESTATSRYHLSTLRLTSMPSSLWNVQSFNFTTSKVPYTWYHVDVVDSLSPTGGPTGGNTSVELYGSTSFMGEGSDYRCKFGEVVVYASYTSNTHTIRCVSPTNAEGDTLVMVGFNGQQYSSLGPNFVYHRLESVGSLSPSSGPARGSTTVLVNGTSFQNFTEIMCKFGSSTVQGSIKSNDQVSCKAPDAKAAGVGGLIELDFNSDVSLDDVMTLYRSS